MNMKEFKKKLLSALGIDNFRKEKEIRDNFSAKYALGLTKFDGLYERSKIIKYIEKGIKDGIRNACIYQQKHYVYTVTPTNEQFIPEVINDFTALGYIVKLFEDDQFHRYILFSWDILI